MKKQNTFHHEPEKPAGKFTFSIIKPNAVKKGYIVPILQQINESGFRISAMKLMQLTLSQARDFYIVHKERPFYNDLVEFMSSSRLVVMILEKEDAVNEFRKLIGSTDPSQAESGTIRNLFADSIQENAIHGSDSDENAERESNFFFSQCERF